MPEEALISIIVVNWNGCHFLPDCLASVEAQTWQAKELILVDNGSVDGSVPLIRGWAADRPWVKTVFLPENTGFTGGNNRGFREARGEWLALLNNDAVAAPGWLAELVRYGDLEHGVGMVASKILFEQPPGIIDKAGHLIYWDGLNRGRGTMHPDRGQFDRAEEVLWPDACAALYHRRLIEETGGFDDTFFAYGDDADLGMRARLLGWRAWYSPLALVHHRHSATAGAYSPLKVMLVERNRLLLAVKNFPLRVLLLNPYWTFRRYAWHGWSALSKRGSAGRFVEAHGPGRLLLGLAWSYLGALRRLPGALRRRRDIQRRRRMGTGEVVALLRQYQITLPELTMQD